MEFVQEIKTFGPGAKPKRSIITNTPQGGTLFSLSWVG